MRRYSLEIQMASNGWIIVPPEGWILNVREVYQRDEEFRDRILEIVDWMIRERKDSGKVVLK